MPFGIMERMYRTKAPDSVFELNRIVVCFSCQIYT